MSKFWIVNLFDKLFITATTFLIIFAWINHYLMDLWLSFVLSLVFSLSFVFILFYLLEKKSEKKNSTIKKQNEINTYFLAFKLSTRDEKIALMSKIISEKNSIISTNGNLKYNCNGINHVMIFQNKTVIDQNDLIEALSKEELSEVDVVDIICEKAQNLNLKILKNKQIKIITKEQLYDDYFSFYNIFPNISFINTDIVKFKFKDLFLTMFEEKHAKGYFFCGLILILSSFIIPYQPYYIVVGSMLLLFALLSKLLPRFKK